jgi:hypothetical protein
MPRMAGPLAWAVLCGKGFLCGLFFAALGALCLWGLILKKNSPIGSNLNSRNGTHSQFESFVCNNLHSAPPVLEHSWNQLRFGS